MDTQEPRNPAITGTTDPDASWAMGPVQEEEGRVWDYAKIHRTRAIRWLGSNLDELMTFTGHSISPPETRDGVLEIKTPHGDVELARGGWLLQDASGDFYPCTDDVFRKTYVLAKPEVFQGPGGPELVIGPRERAYVLIFGRRYELRRPDEGTPSDQQRARTLGTRIAAHIGKSNPSTADVDNLTRDARELIPLLIPEIEEATVKFLRMNELSQIAAAWSEAYGEGRE